VELLRELEEESKPTPLTSVCSGYATIGYAAIGYTAIGYAAHSLATDHATDNI
jgi:hypothetical protein